MGVGKGHRLETMIEAEEAYIWNFYSPAMLGTCSASNAISRNRECELRRIQGDDPRVTRPKGALPRFQRHCFREHFKPRLPYR